MTEKGEGKPATNKDIDPCLENSKEMGTISGLGKQRKLHLGGLQAWCGRTQASWACKGPEHPDFAAPKARDQVQGQEGWVTLRAMALQVIKETSNITHLQVAFKYNLYPRQGSVPS